MSRLLHTVADTFPIKGRGLVIPGITLPSGVPLRVGDPLLLKRPDGSALSSEISGFALGGPPRDDVDILLRGLSKEDVPVGTEIWSVGTTSEERTMPDAKSYPYATHLNVHYPPLEVVDVPALVAACTDKWYNQTLCRVNDSVVRLGVIQGEYHWHKHDTEDEFFYCLDGQLIIDLDGRTVELNPLQGFVVPKGVMHRTRAPERTVILMVEGAGIVPTGDE
jgi:mannose-6-phosphate isomerase-like protein (cupin superfamily)